MSDEEAKETKLKVEDLPKETLYRLYIVEKQSASEIAKSLGISKTTVLNWLDKCDIDRRTTSEGRN